MLIFKKRNLVLFSVPKTGSSALHASLAGAADMVFAAPPMMKHMPVYRYNRFILPLFEAAGMDHIETFALIRNPVSWLGSWYRYRARDELVGHANSTKHVSFDDFVLEAVKGKPAPFAHVGSQEKFLSGGVGPAGVDHLFQYEDRASWIEFLETRLNQSLTLPQLNVSPQGKLALGDRALGKLKKKKAEEFELYASAAR